MNLSVITEKVKSVWDFLKQRRNIVLTLFFLLLLPVTLVAVGYRQSLSSNAAADLNSYIALRDSSNQALQLTTNATNNEHYILNN